MIAEIYHKFSTDLEDVLTGDFFGAMRYMPFNRGLNQIFKNYAVSEDPQVTHILSNAADDDFNFEFWKRSENGLVEIDGFIPLTSVGIGIEVKYRSGLSGGDQLEKEAQVLDEWCNGKEKLLILIGEAEEAKAIYIETPTNPMMNVTDIAALAEIAKRHNLLLIVDNTFLSPYFQNPLDLGADIVVHSGTKFLGGHNDTLAGFLVTNREDISEKLRFLIKTTGSGLAPFDSWLILRGIKTLGIRMEQAQKNAFKIAEWLKTKSAVTRVIYPGLPEHPGYEIMKKQARGFGSMLTFQLESREFALSVLEKVRMIKFAESLGGVETLITYPTTQTHADVPKKIRERNGITEATLRLSVGIEDVQDLLDEFEKVFAETEEELYGGKKS